VAIAAITLLAAFTLVYWFGRKHRAEAALASGVPESQALSRLSQRMLLSFLLFLALVLVYVLVALWSVEFPDAHYVKAPALSGDGPAGPKRPWIDQLDPDQVVAGSSQSTLTVYGYNFDGSSKVYFNAVERPAQLIKGNTLLVSMLPADTAQPGALTVTVISPEASSSRKLPVIPSAKMLGTLKLGIAETDINEETRLVLLVLFAGALGSYIHAIKSLVDYIGNQTAKESWFWFYMTRPFVGMSLALIFYAVIRGGFLAGTPADAKSVNPFGVVALAGLVGMFADKASQKLSEVFDAMFRTDDTRKDKLAALDIVTDTLAPAFVGKPYSQPLMIKGGQAGFTWSAAGLPTGFHIDSVSGTLTGAAVTTGDFKVKITVKDRVGSIKDKELDLHVKE
jgi:hypothetical protein